MDVEGTDKGFESYSNHKLLAREWTEKRNQGKKKIKGTFEEGNNR